MTATTTFDHYVECRTARRPRPRGFDRAVMRLSLAMLVWARKRADRAVISREEQILRFENQRVVERLENDRIRLTTRMH
jgi:hypothetical protein